MCAASFAQAETLKIVVFGDSLTAGFGLDRGQGFVPQLQAKLITEGYDVELINAGVSGDTTSGGRSRLNWSVGPEADGVILELGANDMLRGLPVKSTRENLDAMVTGLKERKLPVLIAGMLASPNMGKEYGEEFNAIYPDLAEEHGTLFYPFFLKGVAGDGALNQPDGMHPTQKGVAVIVENIFPSVKELIEKATAR
ncbi:MAG: arylesterase [Hyphomicrobiales bacterium]